MSVIKKITAWLVLSSQNPTKWSLTIKGALTGGVTILTVVAGLAHINIPGADAFSAAIDAIIGFVQTALLCISAAATAWGLLRKIWSTISGENQVVNSHPVFDSQD